jgi:transmembrane sensor
MNSEDVETSAAAWFAKREGEDWNAADQSQLESWLSSSTAHRIAFLRLETAWERSGRLSALGAGASAGTIPARKTWGFAASVGEPASGRPAERPQSSEDAGLAVEPTPRDISGMRAFSRPQFLRRLRTVAVLLIVTIAASSAWYFSTDHEKLYRTQIGSIATVPLPDGSKVTLNTDSQIHVEVNSGERRIKLEQGEAFFDVAKDASRPFVVEIADKRVIAVGTQFSIRRDDNDIRVLVTEGHVRIERRGISSAAASIHLAAGSEARTKQTAVFVDQPAPALVEQLLSWRTGYIIFRDTALADAVAEFNRYSARKIIIEDPAIAGIRIGGNFRSDDADSFLWLLQSGFPIHIEHRSDRVILTKR